MRSDRSATARVQVEGFCGAQLFWDKAAGTLHSLTLWESWGALEVAIADPRYTEVKAYDVGRAGQSEVPSGCVPPRWRSCSRLVLVKM